MLNDNFYSQLANDSLNGVTLKNETALDILTNPEIELLPLLNAAFQVRKATKGMDVTIHIINNAQNGHCPEDCAYCAQGKSSKANIEEYPMKPEAEILEEAKKAYEAGAFRYCMVFAGRGPSQKRTAQLANLIQKIKSQYPLQICVSAGLMQQEELNTLKAAGLDRLNHNLNTSESFYPQICSTHTYQDRVNTLSAAQKAGLEICSGIIIGMGESTQDIVDVAMQLRQFQAPSIPVNFLVPIEGNRVTNPGQLTPEQCLRALCLFRFLNPHAELRAAAGREGHLRSMEVMCLYPANSIFLDGYLNTKGTEHRKTYQMIKDAGFNIVSDIALEDILTQTNEGSLGEFSIDGQTSILKTLSDLRPKQMQTKR